MVWRRAADRGRGLTSPAPHFVSCVHVREAVAVCGLHSHSSVLQGSDKAHTRSDVRVPPTASCLCTKTINNCFEI